MCLIVIVKFGYFGRSFILVFTWVKNFISCIWVIKPLTVKIIIR